jgi:hypothetical protein
MNSGNPFTGGSIKNESLDWGLGAILAAFVEKLLKLIAKPNPIILIA